MLHAFARNKSNAYRRYLGVRDPSEPRVSSEDEITSLIFGPLDFLSASDNWKLWKLLLQSHASNAMSGPLPANFHSDFFPTACTSEFWPRKDHIEPDLVIEFSDDQGATRSLLVELKWDAGVSGADQLEKQWTRYQGNEHSSSLHIFIAKRMGDLPIDLQPWSCSDTDGSTASRLRAIRWHEFKHELAKLAGLADTSVALKRWCLLAGSFLGQVGIRPFVGFHETVRLANLIPNGAKEHLPFAWRTVKSTTI